MIVAPKLTKLPTWAEATKEALRNADSRTNNCMSIIEALIFVLRLSYELHDPARYDTTVQ